MKRAIRASLWVGIAGLFAGTWAVAQISVTLTGPPPGYSYDGIYVSPYYATVGGVANTPVVCDDFGDDSSKTTWTTTITAFSSISSTNTSWSLAGNLASVSLSQTLSQYDAVASLTMQVLAQTAGSQGQILYSFADWAVFDPTGVATYLTNNPITGVGVLTTADVCNEIFGSGAFSTTTGVCTSGIGGLVGAAYGATVPGGGYNLDIISPDAANGSVCEAGFEKCAAQEFVAVSVPEGGAALAYLFLAGLCCFGAMFMRSRRQIGTIAAG